MSSRRRWLIVAVAVAAASAHGQPTPYVVEGGDRIEQPLAGLAGDAQRGRAVVASRTTGLCLLCHGAPIPEERFQGNLAPDLAGVGARYTTAQLRLRVVDSRVLNPQTIMPASHSTAGLSPVGRAWDGKTILSAQQVEDVVAWLATLR